MPEVYELLGYRERRLKELMQQEERRRAAFRDFWRYVEISTKYEIRLREELEKGQI